MYHIRKEEWLHTANGDPRGYIQPQVFKELWFHTGTVCNLSCPFCLEGSGPGIYRIETLNFDDAKKYIDEAIGLDVEKFCFTGGEPFVVKDFIRILDYALNLRPCLVLTNATEPLIKRIPQILMLKNKPHELHFRISLDYPDPVRHDKNRGTGNFHKSLETLGFLYAHGFRVSIARRQESGENPEEVKHAFRPFLNAVGITDELNTIVFPDLRPPCANPEVPQITENCMTTYKDEKSRSEFMCNYGKMIIKRNGRIQVVPCTLVDDDPDFVIGKTLCESLPVRIMLKHHRCYACFSSGTSCSE